MNSETYQPSDLIPDWSDAVPALPTESEKEIKQRLARMSKEIDKKLNSKELQLRQTIKDGLSVDTGEEKRRATLLSRIAEYHQKAPSFSPEKRYVVVTILFGEASQMVEYLTT